MFKTKKEKTAYKAGIKKGRKGGTVWKRKKHAKKSKGPTKKRKILPVDRERYLVINKLERKVGNTTLPEMSRHTRVSSLSEAQAVGNKIGREWKEIFVGDSPGYKNSMEIYDIRPKFKAKIVKRRKIQSE